MKLSFKFFVLVFSCGLLFFLLTTPLSKLGRMAMDEDLVENTDTHLTSNEMRSFLRLWSVYISKDISRDSTSQLSLMTGDTESKVPPRLVRWLRGQGWTPKRFFYVEQRMKSIVKTALLEKHIQSNMDVLKQNQDATSSTNLRKIIEEQKRTLNIEKVSPEELALIRPNVEYINEVLEGKAVYQP